MVDRMSLNGAWTLEEACGKSQIPAQVPGSVLHDLLPVSIEMTLHDCRGVFNFTNPGAISHNEILDLYKQYIDPSFTYKNFTLEEQAKILAAGRSNNELDSSKLVETCRQFGVEIPPIKKSIVGVFERMQKNLNIHL